MTKNIRNYYNAFGSVFFFAFCIVLFLVSCNHGNQLIKAFHETYYYAYYSENNVLVRYIVLEVNKQNDIITHKRYILNDSGEVLRIENESFLIRNDTIFRKNSIKNSYDYVPLLTVNDTVCITASHGNKQLDFLETEYCFLERRDIRINGKLFRNSLVFEKKTGKIDSVLSRVYYDSCFIPIKEEYVSGYRSYYEIRRIDSILPH